MNFLKKVNLFVLLCVLMLAVHAFAQPVEKGEHIDAGISQNFDSADVINPYYPSGFTIEAAYAGPTILQLRLFGGRGNPHQLFKNKWISFGYAVGYIDVEWETSTNN